MLAAGGDAGAAVGASNSSVVRREVKFGADEQLRRLEAQCLQAATDWASTAVSEASGVAESRQLRFLFKVLKGLSLILALVHDGREALDFSTILALACPAPPAGASLPSPAAAAVADAGPSVLKRVEMSGESMAAANGRRCAMHAVGDLLVVIPQVLAHLLQCEHAPVLAQTAGCACRAAALH